MKRRADVGNWQTRSREFAVGQSVHPLEGSPEDEGRVVAVYPGIGMVDVQFPTVHQRYPVEYLQIRNPSFDPFEAPRNETVPGGAGSEALLPETPGDSVEKTTRLAHRVASKYITALYWADVGRRYRCTRGEYQNGQYTCPKCATPLRPTIYKRLDGVSVRLLGCPTCLFLIREQDILKDHCETCEE